jgi:hypothetical protein
MRIRKESSTKNIIMTGLTTYLSEMTLNVLVSVLQLKDTD